MRKSLKSYLILIVIAGIFVLIGCSSYNATSANADQSTPSPTPPVKTAESADEAASESAQNIAFKFEYSNFAWGYAHRAWHITEAGEVYTYSYNKPDLREPERVSKRSFKSPPTLVQTIDADVLKEKLAMIKQATGGKLTKESAGADRGSAKYSAYLKKNDGSKEEITLRVIGDWDQKNSNAVAHQLFEWLDSLGKEIALKQSENK